VATSCLQISADLIHVACDWRPRGYNLHATGGYSGTIYMRLVASRLSGQLLAKPPVFCKHALRTIILIKK